MEYNIRKKDIQELVCPEHGIIDDEPYEANLKLNQDNTVNITSVEKKMYSRAEVKKLVYSAMKSRNYTPLIEFNNWIKENL